MSAFYAMGIEISPAGRQQLVINIRDGRVAERSETIVGVGICFSGPEPDSITPQSLGVNPATPIGGPIASRYASVLGAGVAAPSTLVMFADGVHVLNSRVEAAIGNPMKDAILPGYFTYEIHQTLTDNAITDALDLRRKCDGLRSAGVPVRRFVACGEMPPDALQIYADVLDAKIKRPASNIPALLGAAILGCIIAGIYASPSQAIHAMAHQRKDQIFRPDLRARKEFDRLYESTFKD